MNSLSVGHCTTLAELWGDVSARTLCPNCNRPEIEGMNHAFYSPGVDFFLCRACRFLWHVPKGKDGPPSQEVLLTAFRRSD